MKKILMCLIMFPLFIVSCNNSNDNKVKSDTSSLSPAYDIQNPKNDFRWERNIYVSRAKRENISLTKAFVEDNWSNSILKTFDIDGTRVDTLRPIKSINEKSGSFVIKSTEPVEFQTKSTNRMIYYIDYTVRLFVYDDSCRICIDNLECNRVIVGQIITKKTKSGIVTNDPNGKGMPMFPFWEEYPKSNGLEITGLYEKDYRDLVDVIKLFFDFIVFKYEDTIVEGEYKH